MQDSTDTELLHAFAARGDEGAFAEVARRYGSLIFGAALRRTGDHGLAEDVTQKVLTTLARRAGELTQHPALAAWLQKTAAFEAMRAMEKESNRRRLMNEYARESATGAAPEEAEWQSALPKLDAAMAALREHERQVLLLRYWQALPFRKIAEVLGSSAAACEKRVERALEKLSRTLRRQGAALSAAALATGLAPTLSKAAVAPGVVARVAASALTAAKAPPGFLTTLILMKSKLAPAAILAALIALCGTGGWVAGRAAADAGTSGANLQPDAPRSAASAAVRSPNSARDGAPDAALDPSLRALLTAAQRDLVTANYDPAAKARAAARIARIAPDDIRAALAMADELIAANGDSGPLAALVLQRWAEFDGAAACDTAHARKAGVIMGLPPLADPIKTWASRDPQAAFQWYRAKAAADEKEQGKDARWKPISSLRWIMGAWALRDMPAAVEAFRSLTDKAEISGALTGFGEMSGTAPGRTAILDAVMSLTEQDRSGGMDLHSILNRWSAHRPEELAAWLDRTKIEKSYHDSTAKPILTGWLRDDAAAAVEWWFQAPGGYPERGHRMTTLMEAWTEADLFAAAEWLAAQPLDETAAASMSTLAGKVAYSDPERGLAWALSIPADHLRKDALRQVAETWAAKDKPAATAAIQAAAMDEAAKTELLNTIGKP